MSLSVIFCSVFSMIYIISISEKIKDLVHSQIFMIISNLIAIFRTVAVIYAVMVYEKVALKNCAYMMHEIFAWLPWMKTLALNFLHLR